jgi:hypothetical protein
MGFCSESCGQKTYRVPGHNDRFVVLVRGFGHPAAGTPVEHKMAVLDENVEAVRAARESLVRKYGGLRGWFRHLQQLDRQREKQAAARQRKPKKGRE